jgi:hypothetical protein
MRYLAFVALALSTLAGCDTLSKAFGDMRQDRWVRADSREASAAYATSEADHLSVNYDRAYIASGRDMSCDSSSLPAFDFECVAFPHN